MSDEGLPRLPPKVERVEFELDVSKVEPHELILKPDWAPFPEPALLATRRVRPAMVVARSLLFIWSATLLVAAFVARSNALERIDRGSTIRIVGWSGVLVAAVFAALGWRWSDRKTQNLHMLEARLPTRFWCARAWVAPFLWSGVLAGTILQLGPGELLDVRPAIAVPIFAAALWRPYALVRRIVASLIRVRFDPLIGTAYVLDLTAFGLLWWQLWTFPDFIVSSNSGSIDVLIGVSAAATVAFGANVVVWILLLRNVERAQAHRLIAVRTRHDHRQLRLRGIDPMDREVRWALLKIKAARDEERAAATVIAAGAALRQATRRARCRRTSGYSDPRGHRGTGDRRVAVRRRRVDHARTDRASRRWRRGRPRSLAGAARWTLARIRARARTVIRHCDRRCRGGTRRGRSRSGRHRARCRRHTGRRRARERRARERRARERRARGANFPNGRWAASPNGSVRTTRLGSPTGLSSCPTRTTSRAHARSSTWGSRRPCSANRDCSPTRVNRCCVDSRRSASHPDRPSPNRSVGAGAVPTSPTKRSTSGSCRGCTGSRWLATCSCWRSSPSSRRLSGSRIDRCRSAVSSWAAPSDRSMPPSSTPPDASSSWRSASQPR